MIEVHDVPVETTAEGFLRNSEQWNEAVAQALAAQIDVSLTDAHWEIIRFMRNYYIRFNHLPASRLFVKAVEKEFGKEKGNSRYLHRLFPGAPLKHVCLIAGLPKPPGCI